MCGIFAAFNPNGITDLNKEKLQRSTYAVEHRGPDNVGFYSDTRCFLGHTRLSIVGTDASGNQPFPFKNLVITYNGEIFNYIELREELSRKGYSFETHSDTEVLIQAYHCWGNDCFEKFNGMWALVIYDTEKKRLIVSRDRFGQKPLFVARVNGTYFFASEISQLVEHISRRINYKLIQNFLKEGAYEGAGKTFFSDIDEFPKAHFFEIMSDSSTSSTRYWNYPSGSLIKTDSSSFKHFEELLTDAVRIRLRADVPIGVMLSGGVDSTLIAAIVRNLAGPKKAIQAFNYASRDQDDESKYAEAVAQRVGLDLIIREQDSEPKEYVARLKDLVKHLGRGHSSPAIVSIDYLYESLAKKGIRVAIDGQGADELLAGYKQFYPEIIISQFSRGNFVQAYRNLRVFLSQGSQYDFGVITVLIMHIRVNFPAVFRKFMRLIYGYETLFKKYKKLTGSTIVPVSKSEVRNSNAVNRHLQAQHVFGLENLLYYGDIVAMKNSVENRSPFLDHRLVEFSFQHDEMLKVCDGEEKFALRRLSFYDRFNDLFRRNKIGFSSNIKLPTKKYMVRILQMSPILEWPIFSYRLKLFLNSERALRPKYERLLFRLFQVHLWNEEFSSIEGVDKHCFNV